MYKRKPSIESFSDHLFWDVNRYTLDLNEHASYIVQQVMMYGLIEDWKLISTYYNHKELVDIVTNLRVLDDFSISFLSLILDVPETEFRCYNIKQSRRNFWDY